MIKGMYGAGDKPLPQVVHISVARYHRTLPKPGEPLDFLVTIHEEGRGISWSHNVTVAPDTERALLHASQELYDLSQRPESPSERVVLRAQQLGQRLYRAFLGEKGEEYLKSLRIDLGSTSRGREDAAVLMDVDETLLNLPWELLASADGVIAQAVPFGRLVSTRAIPRRGRDPLREDAVVRILAVIDPTGDLLGAEAEAATLADLQRAFPVGGLGAQIELRTLERERATRALFSDELASGAYDVLHFSGHAALDTSAPERSAMLFADGPLLAADILNLPWREPPYLVFSSACESGQGVAGKRLVAAGDHTNGLAAAFLAAGAEAYAGFFWPVTEGSAAVFAGEFYRALFERENIGLAFLSARRRAVGRFSAAAALTGYGAVLFGDAGGEHRRDLALAV